MKLSKDEAIMKAEAVMKGFGIPFGDVDAEAVESAKGNHWLVSFKGYQDQDMLDGNVSFVVVNDETGEAHLKPYP